jgi:hypothetical protein
MQVAVEGLVLVTSAAPVVTAGVKTLGVPEELLPVDPASADTAALCENTASH